MLRSIVCCGLISAALSLATPAIARAQTDEGQPETQETAPAQPEQQVLAPYDDKLLRLAEVLGSIHYLRTLCGANEGTKWRDVMAELLEAEKPAAKRRAQLVSRFNRGYGAFEQSYATCTQSAIVAADRYVKEGVRLSSQITTRYGR